MGADNPAAPGDLEKVRQFVNTLDIEDAVDAIATPGALDAWLHRQALVDEGTDMDATSVTRAQQLRESIRACLLANHERAAVPPSARAVLNDVAHQAQLTLSLDAQGQWRPAAQATSLGGALGSLVAIVAGSMTAGDWQRLKVCLNDACGWAFYDHSRARTGRWCSMQVCGNRSKQQAWRHRRASTDEQSKGPKT